MGIGTGTGDERKLILSSWIKSCNDFEESKVALQSWNNFFRAFQVLIKDVNIKIEQVSSQQL